MKEVSKDLNTYLNTAKNLTSCDLYELDLTDGRKFYYADTDMDIVYNGQVYLHDRLLIKRAQIKLQSEVVVDTMTVTVYASRQDKLDTEQILKAAHEGVLDRSTLHLRRCFFRDTTIIDAISLFGGNVEVKAKTQGLNMAFPVRKYYPQGTYSVSTGNQVIASTDTDSTCLICPYVPRKEVLL